MRIISVVVLIICLCIAANAQDSLNVSLVGSLYENWDVADDVKVIGDYAYVAAGYSGLRILDISDPETPIEVGYCQTPDDAEAVDVQGNYAYIADWEKALRIIDISDPSDPHEVGFLETSSWPECVAVEGNYAYITGWGG